MFDVFKVLLGRHEVQDNLLLQARAQIIATLAEADTLLQESCHALAAGTVAADLEERARNIDKASNKAERSLRKMLVEHLGFSQHDAAACLVMMSVGKDVERLVDECRNLVDIAVALAGTLPEPYRQSFAQLGQDILAAFAQTRKAFADNDEATALNLVETEKTFIAQAHQLGDRILDDEELGVRRAVLLSRGVHFVRRLRAHLANIASTVVFPVHRIDFAKRSYIRDAREEFGLTEGDHNGPAKENRS